MSAKITIGGKAMGRDAENDKKWRKASLFRYEINLNRENDKDVLEYFEPIPNKRQYLIGLIKKDMEEKKSAS